MSKGSISKITIISLLLFSAFLNFQVHAEEESSAQYLEVTAEGYAEIGPSGVNRFVKDDALVKAKRNAVEKALGIYIESSSLAQEFQLVEDRILSRSKGFVASYEIIREIPSIDLYTVVIRAKVKTSELLDETQSLRLLIREKGNPILHVNGKNKWYVTRVSQELNEKDFELTSTVEQATHGIDIEIIDAGKTLIAKIVHFGTKELLLILNIPVNNNDTVISEVVDKIIKTLLSDENFYTRKILINLEETTYQGKLQFYQDLSKIKEIVDIEERGFDSGIAEYIVRYNGQSADNLLASLANSGHTYEPLIVRNDIIKLKQIFIVDDKVEKIIVFLPEVINACFPQAQGEEVKSVIPFKIKSQFPSLDLVQVVTKKVENTIYELETSVENSVEGFKLTATLYESATHHEVPGRKAVIEGSNLGIGTITEFVNECVELIAGNFLGTINLASDPVAELFIDEKNFGETPVKMSLAEGKYNVSIKPSDESFETWHQEIDIKGGEFWNPGIIKLKIRKVNVEVICSSVAGATLFLNDEAIGPTPARISVMPGTYNLTLKHPDFHSKTISQSLGYNSSPFLNIQLEKLPPQGSVFVRTNSNNPLTVYIDGTPAGFTNSEISGVQQGRHRIQVIPEFRSLGELDEFIEVVENQKVELEHFYKAQVEVKNDKWRIDSLPGKAKLYVNDEYKGETPVSVEGYAGDVKIRLEKKDYHSIDTVLTAKDYSLLKLHPILGTFSVTCQPVNGTIFINDKRRGNTPAEFELEPDVYTVKIVPPFSSLRTEVKQVAIKPGESSQWNVEFVEDDGLKNTTAVPVVSDEDSGEKIKWQIVTIPPGANVIVDGKDVGVSPVTINQLPGQADLELTMDGFKKYSKNVRVQKVSYFKLEQEEQAKSVLNITSSPVTGTVYINNQSVGTTPITCELKAATYTIKVVPSFRSMKEKSLQIKLLPGEEKSIEIDFMDE